MDAQFGEIGGFSKPLRRIGRKKGIRRSKEVI
jgi:hypothetical protein